MLYDNAVSSRKKIIRSYNREIGGIEEDAISEQNRAYGGVVRSAKGKLVEQMATDMVAIAWQDCGGSEERMTIGKEKSFKVPIQKQYLDGLSLDIKEHIRNRIQDYSYRARVDRHIFIDNTFVMGIECKAYAENAMLKRILFDFRMLKTVNPDLTCCLLQLESMLGGDYSDPLKEPKYGSPSSHTIMSFFPEVELHVLTLLEGERKVDRPIHQPEYFKKLEPAALDSAIGTFSRLLAPFA